MRFPKGKAAEFWREKVKLYQTSEVSVKEFCQREGLAVQSFYLWRRKLADQASTREEQGVVPVTQRAIPRFLPVAIMPSPNSPIEIALDCGATIRVVPGCDLSLLQSVVACLSGAAAC